MFQTFLRMVFSTTNVEKRYRGKACRMDFNKMSLDGLFRALKVQEESQVSNKAIRSLH